MRHNVCRNGGCQRIDEALMRQRKKASKSKKPRAPGAPKKSKTPRVPKTRCSGTMTESAYWGFIRSALRAKSRRWRPIYDCLNAARRPSKNPNKRLKWEAQCNVCKEWWPLAKISIDHIVPAGSLTKAEDLAGFVSRLFCEKDALQALCAECHTAKTAKERDEYRNQ